MFKTKNDKMIDQFLDSIGESPRNVFEQMVLLNEKKQIVEKINFLPNDVWDVFLSYTSEKNVKKMMKKMIGSSEELEEIRKEICEGYSLECTLLYGGFIYSITINQNYLSINMIGDIDSVAFEDVIYDKHFEMSLYYSVEELCEFIREEMESFTTQNKPV